MTTLVLFRCKGQDLTTQQAEVPVRILTMVIHEIRKCRCSGPMAPAVVM